MPLRSQFDLKSSFAPQGVLSLANGDSVEGLFNGDWTSGLKVVGTYTKPTNDEPGISDRESQL